MFCVYLTSYRGNKLPPFYIGSTSVKRIESGYRGSVRSKKYQTIWESELKNNPQFFSTKIISLHLSNSEALDKEEQLQRHLDVIRSPLYINMAFAKRNFGPISHTKESRAKISASNTGNHGSTRLQNQKSGNVL